MNMTKQRSLILFEESIRSKYTKHNYTSNLNRFLKFAGIDSPNRMLSISQSTLQRMLEDYLMELKRNTNPNNVPSMFRGIKHFCIMNDINPNWNILYKMFPQRQKTQNLRAYTKDEIVSILSCTKNIRNRALIYFLTSTGARIGVFDHELSIRHTKSMSHGCIAVLLYAGHLEEYWSFLTPQASRTLTRYHNHRRQEGEILSENTPLFATSGTIRRRQLGWSGARSVVHREILQSGITRNKHNGRYDVQTDHGFRKRFNTILKIDNSVNYNIAEKLMGHKNGLDGVYLTPTVEELFTEFRKVMHKMEI